MKDQQLKVTVENDILSISIGVDMLRHSAEIGRRYGTGEIIVTDQKTFIDGIAKQLDSPDEDGSTLVHELFDKAVSQMLEDGELGVDLADEDY